MMYRSDVLLYCSKLQVVRMRSRLRVLLRAVLVMPSSSAAARRSKEPGKSDSSSRACRNSSGRVLTI